MIIDTPEFTDITLFNNEIQRPNLPESVMNMTYRCDECKQTFKGYDIVLHPFHNNVRIFAIIRLIENGTTSIGSSNPDNLPKENQYTTMHCPHCDMVHLFGFDAA